MSTFYPLNANVTFTGTSTFSGDVNIGANALKTTNLMLKQLNASTFVIMDSAGLADKYIEVQGFYVWDGLAFMDTIGNIYPKNADNTYVKLMARDNGVDRVEVARLQGAAAPSLCVGNSGVTPNDDFAGVADQVNLGNYDIAAGRRTLAIGTEEAVAAGIAVASTHTLSVRKLM